VVLRKLLRRPVVCYVRFHINRAFAQWAFAGKRRPDALLWTSLQQREDCANAVEGLVPLDRQHVVPLGLNLDTFGTKADGRAETRQRYGIRPGEIVIGTASALRPIKRIHEFIELVGRLARADERVVGLIAGDAMPGGEPYRDRLIQQIRDTGLGRRLQWLGHLEPVEPFHQAIDIFVSTSEYETFGNSVCEAMACRRAVAAYRGGSVHEVVGEAGRIVETGDLAALTEAVAELVGRPELCRELGERGRARMGSHFNPAQSLQQLKQIYGTLLADAHPGRNSSKREPVNG
jgi:glycosyltransferase involved in cell wall biosynthesis